MKYTLPIREILQSALNWEIKKGTIPDGRYDSVTVYVDGRVVEVKFVPVGEEKEKEADGN